MLYVRWVLNTPHRRSLCKGLNKVFQRLSVLLIFLAGCASMLPSIESQHPVGYKKLIEAQAVCAEKDLKTYNACLSAANILESASPQQATQRFLVRWEEAAFGMAARSRNAGEMTMPIDPSGGVYGSVWESVRMDELRAMEKIVLPVLRKIYEETNSEYSNAMLSQVDLIIPGSKSSFDSFQEVHSDLLKEGFTEKK